MCTRSEGRDQTRGGMGGRGAKGGTRELPWGGPRVIGRTLGVNVGRSKSSKYKVTLRQGRTIKHPVAEHLEGGSDVRNLG